MASDARLSNQLDLFGYELKDVREAFVPAEVAEVVPMPRTLPPRPPLRSVHLLSAEVGAAEVAEPSLESQPGSPPTTMPSVIAEEPPQPAEHDVNEEPPPPEEGVDAPLAAEALAAR